MNSFLKIIKMKETQAFQQYQLSISRNNIRVFAVLLGMFDLLLLIPDIININNPIAGMIVIVLRVVLACGVFSLYYEARRIKEFKTMALAVSVCEVLSVAVYCAVFFLYETPDFMIQLIGLFISVLAFFVIPNRWINKVIVSILAAISFMVCAVFAFETVTRMQLVAGTVYLGVEIMLCGAATWHYYRYKRDEFMSKVELERIYATDPLTQVGNRVRLEDEAEKWIEFCSRHGLELSLVLVDVDNLKQINDRYGHLIGDVILYEVAQIMHTQLRKNDVCTRWGGDEFVILLPNTSVNESMLIVERIRYSISDKDYNIDIPITCSFGITRLQKDDDLQQLVKRADKSMYIAKGAGKNTIVIQDAVVESV